MTPQTDLHGGVLPSLRRAHRFPARRALTVLLTASALLASLLASCGPAAAATAVPARTSTEKTIINAVFAELNKERKAHHLRALTENADLQLSARRHDVTMAAYDSMSHQLPHEAYFASRITAAGYHWTWAGENIAYNTQMTTSGVLMLQRMMYNEKPPNDGHRVNILSSKFANVGVDVLLDKKHHRAWLTTDFGRH